MDATLTVARGRAAQSGACCSSRHRSVRRCGSSTSHPIGTTTARIASGTSGARAIVRRRSPRSTATVIAKDTTAAHSSAATATAGTAKAAASQTSPQVCGGVQHGSRSGPKRVGGLRREGRGPERHRPR